MAFSCVTRNLVFPLLVLLLITPLSSSFSPSDKVTKELINQLCAEPTINNPFCLFWLTSDPTTITLDLNGLVQLVLKKTQLFGYNSLASMKDLAGNTPDPKLKNPYKSCVLDYQLAITAIERAQVLASSKSYQLVSEAASLALDSISSCKDEFEGLTNVPAGVPLRNKIIGSMCNIDSVFSKVLSIQPAI